MPTRNYNGDVVSGSFKKLKFPFLIEQMSLYSERYSGNVGLKFYRKCDEHHYSGERRTFIQPVLISHHGLTLKHVYLGSYFNIDLNERHGTLKIIGIDLV